ncbi:uncharacterized protein LOC113522077 isoform X2 [Galleria mellonella]|uniref:Phospholipase A2 n=1 Tax=Galleria mellonella TaxID=7137 RepID=A0A6J3CDV7_GALME|nr:uncharacterized protein LOC113522077 isoform X2 [Galleria mellonella]
MMECKKTDVCENVNKKIVNNFMRKRRKLTYIKTIYASLIVCFVPSIICDSDWSRELTYDKIYNNTNYPQLQHRPRPYTIPIRSFNKQIDYRNEEEWKENELGREDNESEERKKEESSQSRLLVGFAQDPFRYSIPEEEFLKGIRYVNPRSNGGRRDSRGKRGLLHLYNMIYCATGCEPLSYKGYGCYCGLLGSGKPTDGIDRCCKMHDDCYENIYCPIFTVYFQPYYWKCYKGEPLCALENYDTQHQFINGCAAKLCECDRRFAMCVRKYNCPRQRALCKSSPLRLLQNLLLFW